MLIISGDESLFFFSIIGHKWLYMAPNLVTKGMVLSKIE